MGASSQHFPNAELACPCCGVNDCKQSIVDALEAYRAACGKPVSTHSAYRCEAHNAAVGGAPNSQHKLGIAADISVYGVPTWELEAIAEKIPGINGIGRDDHKGFVHIDTRDTPARWCYDAHGATVKWYPAVQPENTERIS